MNHIKHFIIGILLSVTGCTVYEQPEVFDLLTPEQTRVDFENVLTPREDFNMYLFRNFYNGGGVAVGDINNDGRPDIFLTGNMVSNRLYLNKGNFKFDDITESAGLRSDGYWSTGTSMADVNGDGWLDIFVALSGPNEGEKRHNRLYINNQDGSFSEQSGLWGLDHIGLSTSGHFFDADRDGDLDLLLLTNSFENLESFREATSELRYDAEQKSGLVYYEHVGDQYIDATARAGFLQNNIAFPLSASIGDLDNDGWPDVFVANDFFERDYLFINQQDGSFIESFEPPISYVGSLSSMGSDFADFSNDGWLDLYVSDMRPSSPDRFHSKMTYETWEEYSDQKSRGFGNQVTRNTLFQNISLVQDSETPTKPSSQSRFTLSEQSRLTNSEASDWSWAVLIADYDLNSYQDILVTNGIGVDLLDQDYINQMMNPRQLAQRYREGETNIILSMLENLDSDPQPNALYAQVKEMDFENVSTHWGLGQPSFSSGAAWGDFDADGDLDIVINDVNGPAKIYKNKSVNGDSESNESKNWVSVSLHSNGQNTHAVGARVDLWAGEQMMRRDNIPQRGFQSSVEPGVWFGLGSHRRIDSLRVTWPDGTIHHIRETSELPMNRTIELHKEDIEKTLSIVHRSEYDSQSKTLMYSELSTPLTPIDPKSLGIEFSHKAFDLNEFKRDPLLFHMRSTEGPALCKGDINGDNLEDFYIGGARGQSGALFIQTGLGSFSKRTDPQLVRELDAEEVDCMMFDANNDGLDDLYIVSGGNSLVSSSTALSDRMVMTTQHSSGELSFIDTNQFLPVSNIFESTSIVAPYDFTGDGILDLFVGTRLKPFKVGLPANGYLLEGDGKGGFRDVTEVWAPELDDIGMITHAVWTDVVGDKAQELVIVGEYMPVTVFGKVEHENVSSRYENLTEELGLEGTNGWWNRVIPVDVDGDDQLELIGLNHGLNSIFRASTDKPVTLWVGDFTQNGLIEHVLATNIDGKNIPVALKHKMEEHIPMIGLRFPTYAEYAGKAVEEMFTSDELNSVTKLEAYMMESVVIDWERDSSQKPDIRPLPRWAQVSPMYAGAVIEIEQQKILLVGGNLYKVKPQVGAYDASIGTAINLFENVEWKQSGFEVFGEVREIMEMELVNDQTDTNQRVLIVARHNDTPIVFGVNP